MRTVDTADWFNLVCSSMPSDQIHAGKLQVRQARWILPAVFPPVGKVSEAIEKVKDHVLVETWTGRSTPWASPLPDSMLPQMLMDLAKSSLHVAKCLKVLRCGA